MEQIIILKPALEIIFLLLLIILTVRPIGIYLFKSLTGEKSFFSPLIKPIEIFIYRICHINTQTEQTWKEYGASLLIFNSLGILFLFLIQLIQKWLPLNPENLPNVNIDLAINTAVSFTTNTNWQSYVPEKTVSYLTQMLGLAVQNFLSAATGMTVALALIRGLIKREEKTIGNFWIDLTRTILYVLLPVAFIFAIVLIWQGVPQNFNGYTRAINLEGTEQIIAQGPVASQEVIKEFGTNGGGFFNANSSHPYENPTPLSNILEIWLIAAIGTGLTYMFGKMVGNNRQGKVLLITMLIILFLGAVLSSYFEWFGNPSFTNLYSHDITQNNTWNNPGGNMEGKELRFGHGMSGFWSTLTTGTSTGAVNNMHSSLMPVAQFVALFNMQLGELIIGGVGAGLYTILLFAIITVFIAGLMVGRTPEYLGKKVGPTEIKSTILAVLVPSILILVFSAIAVMLNDVRGTLGNAGPHGFSEILYAYTSGAANNGSAFASLNANTPFWNLTLAFDMLMGRFIPIILIIYLAGKFAERKYTPPSSGTFPTTGLTFIVLLIGVIIIVGGLTFFPALVLGPIVEHFLLFSGTLF